MDQQSYYSMYGKHNFGTLNYQMPFDASCGEYQAVATAVASHADHLHHSTLQSGLNFNNANSISGSAINTGNCNNVTANNPNATQYHKSSNSHHGVVSGSHSSNNNATSATHKPIDISMPYNTLYPSVIGADNGMLASNVINNAPTSNCNNIVYGGAYNKLYDAHTSATNANSVSMTNAVVTSNNTHTTNSYYTNLGYGSCSEIDYSLHKNVNQYFLPTPTVSVAAPVNDALSTTHNRNTHPMNTATAFTSNITNESVIHPTAKHCNSSEAKTATKTSVIKPLNTYKPTPLNYGKYVSSYPSYVSNKPVASSVDKTSSNNRAMYLSGASNYKNSEIYCPEPISARYANHAYGVTNNSAANATNTSNGQHFLASNNYLNYSHQPLPRHQSTVHHTRSVLPPAYPTQYDENASTTSYYNMQNGLLVRPTPNTYKQCQIPTFQNSYNYSRTSNNNNALPTTIANTVSASENHATSVAKPQSQKASLSTEIVNPIPPIDDGLSYDRHYSRAYNSGYSTNYMDTFDDYQYTYLPPAVNSSLCSSKSTWSGLKHYDVSNATNNTTHQQPEQPIAQPVSTSSSTTIQHPVPINPNSASQLISNEYDTNWKDVDRVGRDASNQVNSALHTMIPPPPLLNKNKDCTASNQYQHSSYKPQAIYPSYPQTNNYIPSNFKQNSSSASTIVAAPTVPISRTNLSQTHEKFTLIDLEEQINSSKILKSSRTLPSLHRNNPTSHCGAEDARLTTSNLQANQSNANYNKSAMQNHSNKNQYVYNYNAYNNCYQQQQWHSSHSLPVAQASSETLKKQSLRDFLSTWNDDEEEEGDASGKRSNKHPNNVNTSSASASQKYFNYAKSDKSSFNPQVIVPQPIHQNQHNHLQAPPTLQPIYKSKLQAHLQSHVQPRSDNPATTATSILAPPKIHVGITVDNGGNSAHNLPDIIIDIEKPKVNESECFERVNVIQEVPKMSEKLYILDSIDVPISDLNKYRHLSVVNKLPDNIVLPPMPPLKHEDSVSESLKFIAEAESNHARYFKNDFEMNVEYDDDGKCMFNTKDLVECKNITTVQNVRKIIRKYRKQREYMRKAKMASNHTSQRQVAMQMETSSNLSTPLKSLSPSNEFNSTDPMMYAQFPVDLSVNSKESAVDEFIDTLSLGTNDSESHYDLSTSPLEEILKLTSSPTMTNVDEPFIGADAPVEKVIDDVNSSTCVLNEKTVCNSQKIATETAPFETLKSICIRTVNTYKFRNYFTETVIKAVDDKVIDLTESEDEFSSVEKTSVEQLISVNNASVKEKSTDDCIIVEEQNPLPYDDTGNFAIVDEKSSSLPINDNDDCAMHEEPVASLRRTPTPITEPAPNQSVNDDVPLDAPESCSMKDETIVSSVPSLKHLAMQANRLNQFYLNLNIKSAKISCEYNRKTTESESNADPNANTVRTLQELAREVANTIYSFNVKPLQDICKLAIEKYNQLFVINQMEMENGNEMNEEMEVRQLLDCSIIITKENLDDTRDVDLPKKTICDAVMSEPHHFNVVKSLQTLAKDCAAKFELTQERMMDGKGKDVVYVSSDSDSDTSSNATESESIEDDDSQSESGSSSESDTDSSSSSSSESDEKDAEENSNKSCTKDDDNVEHKNEKIAEKIDIVAEEKPKEGIINAIDNADLLEDINQINDEIGGKRVINEGDQIEEKNMVIEVGENVLIENVENLTDAVSLMDSVDGDKNEIIAGDKKDSDHESEMTMIDNESKAIEQNENKPIDDVDSYSVKIDENMLPECEEEPLQHESSECSTLNPMSLKDLCQNVLNQTIMQDTVPTLRSMCENLLSIINGSEGTDLNTSVICFVNDETSNGAETEASIWLNESESQEEEIFFCVNSEFDETELAKLINGGLVQAGESLEDCIATPTVSDNIDLTAQCMALQNILASSPQQEQSQLDQDVEREPNESIGNVTDDIQHNIQYQEIVPSFDNSNDEVMVQIEPFKKYLQNKYVQTSNYFKMLIVNRILKKYIIYQRPSVTKSKAVQKRLHRSISKIRQRKRERCVRMTRQSCETKNNDQQLNGTHRSRANEKIIKNDRKHHRKKHKNNNETIKCDIVSNNKIKITFNRNKSNANSDALNNDTATCKIAKNSKHDDKNIQIKKHSSNTNTNTNTNDGNDNTNDGATITCDILKSIAKKRNLKRKHSNHTPKMSNDDYCYDEDGQISEMLSSFINDKIADPSNEPIAIHQMSSKKLIDGNEITEPSDDHNKITQQSSLLPPPSKWRKTMRAIIPESPTTTLLSDRLNEKRTNELAQQQTTVTTTNVNETQQQPIKLTPEMTTIPLELKRSISHEQNIREYYENTNSYQRRILSKFANNIKQNKLNFEDILINIKKLYRKSTPSSSSAESSSSSSSSSSDSESSSEKYRNGRRSRRSRKRRTHSYKRKRYTRSHTRSRSPSRRHRSQKYRRKSHRKSSRRMTRSQTKKSQVPIFDIETIKRNAFMGCESLMKKNTIYPKMTCPATSSTIATNATMQNIQSMPIMPNIPNMQNMQNIYRIAPNSVANDRGAVSTTVSHEAPELSRVPYVKLYRSQFIDEMAQKYVRDRHSHNNNNSYRRPIRNRRKT